jgi:putative salt-induced outer membrane protein YdiY
MMHQKSFLTCCFTLLIAPNLGFAQPAAKPDPDVLIFSNGEKLVGKLVRSDGATVVFHSDSLGDVKADWSKIQELHAAQKFVAVEKGVRLNRHSDVSKLPTGAVSLAEKRLAVGAQTVPVADVSHLIDQPAFEKAVLHSPGFFQAWTGTVTAGASLVEATQKSQTFTGGIGLLRATPAENWLDARNRTTADFSASDGSVSQPGSPKLKTAIFHADAERDEYLSRSHAYFFVQSAFDHNFSQGLDLQQMYGGGFGWTVLKQARQTLDLKGSISYERQTFQTAASDRNLVGSVFSENYVRKLAGGVTLLEGVSITPSWNVSKAYSWTANTSLNIPVHKRLGFSVVAQDTFLNDPPPSFKKNSFQLTMGLSYSLNK